MSVNAVQSLCLPFAEIAANTEETWYLPVPWPGTWKLIAAYFTPYTARTADDTNYCDLTIKKGSASLGVMSVKITGGTGDLVAGTAETISLTGTGQDLEFAQGASVVVAKTDPGNGLALDGALSLAFEKVRA